MSGPSISGYTGSATTRDMVATEIERRWGKAEVKKYDPEQNTCLTFAKWLSLNFVVKKGEKAIKSVTFVEQKDAKGNVIKKIPRPVFLFYVKQIEPRKEKV
ncbi:hypothetical protein A2851_01370 [Candidatus Kaiserbacteria bacterium RIFCSPHIGHO2_01_FULL_53_29]|nr:MAG: hypothetical protein A2851_01370 [Candidatus Kaiserbacteria bacterium RIFCSPHIGHO2_01_FULL_53_29]